MESYVRGPAGALVQNAIGAVFLQTASRFGERLAVVDREQDIRLTWADYARESTRTAAGLRSLGLEPGDRVGIWATNCVEWVLLQFGCALAGLVLVNVNPASRSHELSFILRKSRMKALFMRDQDRRADYRSILEGACAGGAPAPKHVIVLGSPEWQSFLVEPGTYAAPTIEPEAAANIQ